MHPPELLHPRLLLLLFGLLAAPTSASAQSAGGITIRPSIPAPGTVIVRRPNLCDVSSDCGSGSECIDRICVATGGESERCRRTACSGYTCITAGRCDAGLACHPMSDSCEHAGGDGEPCREWNRFVSSPKCDAGLSCQADRLCHRPARVPQPAVQASVWEAAWQSLWMSRIAYWDGWPQSEAGTPEAMQICAERFGLDFLEYVPGTRDAETLFAADASHLVVAFAGSESGSDWTLDLATVKSTFEGVAVHSGFIAKTAGAWPAVKRVVAAQLAVNPGKEIWLVGHSLGGAMAQMIAIKLYEEYKNHPAGVPMIRVITFGSPKVGGNAWKRKYESYPNLRERTTRWVNHEDLIANYPGLVLGGDWQHAGKRNQIYRDSDAGCDLKGLSSWGEYLDFYAEPPRCSPTSTIRVWFNSPEVDASFWDAKFGYHKLLDGYRKSLQLVTPAAYRDFAGLTCSPFDHYPRAPTCPVGKHCSAESQQYGRCDCVAYEP